MQQSYTLIIKDEKYKSYKKLASFLFLINAIVFIILAIRSVSVSNQLILFTAAFILIAYSVYNWSYKKKKERSYFIVYLLIATIWISDSPFWYFSILLLLLLVLQFRMESDFTISLSGQTVTIDGFINKGYSWSDFNNIVLKDDLLTLDFTNNKILQVEPDWNMSIHSGGIEAWEVGEGYPETEQEFNEFCKERLKSGDQSLKH
ncbi:MAG: hypothetical protein ABIR30_12520 [Chitinophagaceae bacterium]